MVGAGQIAGQRRPDQPLFERALLSRLWQALTCMPAMAGARAGYKGIVIPLLPKEGLGVVAELAGASLSSAR